MKNILSILVGFLSFAIVGCTNSTALDEDMAEELVTAHLKSNPEYKTVKIEVGEVKFRNKNGKALLDKYKTLENKGLINMGLQNQKKKFLSRDSTYFYMVSLSDDAKPYILKQGDSQATLKAVDYQLDGDKPISLLQSDSKLAKVTVSLKKVENDFAIFLKNKGTASNFITKTYRAKLNKEEGWILVGE